MSNATLAWSLAFTISVAVLMLSDFNTITFQNEAAGQKQENSTSVLANNNDTIIKKANTPINNNLINEGISLLILRKYNEALNLFDRVLAVDPNNTLALTNKGTTLVYLQKYDEALNLFDKALAIEPNNTSTLDSKGNVLASLHKYNEALNLFDRVLAVDPNDVKTLTNKGNVLDTLGKHHEAIS